MFLLPVACCWPLSCFSFYHQLAADPASFYWRYALLGFFVGIVGIVPYVMVNAFLRLRCASPASFFYNVAYAIFGGLTPMCHPGYNRMCWRSATM